MRTAREIVDGIDADASAFAAAAAALGIQQAELLCILDTVEKSDEAFVAADSNYRDRALAAEAELRHRKLEDLDKAVRAWLPTGDEVVDTRCALQAAEKIGALRSGTAWFDRIEAAVAYRDSRIPCSVCEGTGENRTAVIDTNPPMYYACSACRGTGTKVKP